MKSRHRVTRKRDEAVSVATAVAVIVIPHRQSRTLPRRLRDQIRRMSVGEERGSTIQPRNHLRVMARAAAVETTRITGIIGPLGIVQRTGVDVAAVMNALPDHHIVIVVRLLVHPPARQADVTRRHQRRTDLIRARQGPLEDDHVLLHRCVPRPLQSKTDARHGVDQDQDRGLDLPRGIELITLPLVTGVATMNWSSKTM